MLDLLASTEEQLKILVPYLEDAAKIETLEPLRLTNASYALAARVLVGWKPHVNNGAVSAEGAFLYYKELTNAVLP